MLNTNFFDEENFEGLVEKVRERGGRSSMTQQAVHDQVARLFDPPNLSSSSRTTSAASSEQSDDLLHKVRIQLSIDYPSNAYLRIWLKK